MRAVRAAVFAAVMVLVPWWWCARGADGLYDGDLGAQRALADGLVAALDRGVSVHTGSDRFDGEWTLVTSQMAALGLGQVVLAHPSLRPRYQRAIERCVDAMLAPRVRAFGTAAWHEDGLVEFGSPRGHAYLGYLGLALGMLRRIDPGTRHAALHDQLVATFASRVAASRTGLIETYPGERYPDVAAVIGAIGLHGAATGADHTDVLRAWHDAYVPRYVDPATGLLWQSADEAGAPADAPRGSGTAIAAYFLSFADPALSASLRRSLAARGRASLLGFGGVREYPSGRAGRGDIDSGPVLLGVSVSATAFGLAAARQSGDRGWFTELSRTASLFGVQRDDGWVTGSTFGNAILLAMSTAERR
ncbi:MAG: hypothetical protein U0325_36290 [Polyangiales bacterium]